MLDLLTECKLCPRNCGVNRLEGEFGFCQAGINAKVARVALHQWEEPCISGSNGSGTVFFSNCNLKCVFCQNHTISHDGVGKEVSIERLAELFLEQQAKGAHNINLVTPTHYVPQIVEAIKLSKDSGLTLPILYNTNSYENVETIRLLKGHVDVYLPDLKYFNDTYALKYSNAKGYFNYALKVIKEMLTQVDNPVFDQNGLIKKGVIIRHLMLPGLLFDSKKIMDLIYYTFSEAVYISLMNQYTPMHNAGQYREINKQLNHKHYDALVDYCFSIGLANGFIQEDGTASEKFVPDFDLSGL